jgi:hypothetical protein
MGGFLLHVKEWGEPRYIVQGWDVHPKNPARESHAIEEELTSLLLYVTSPWSRFIRGGVGIFLTTFALQVYIISNIL